MKIDNNSWDAGRGHRVRNENFVNKRGGSVEVRLQTVSYHESSCPHHDQLFTFLLTELSLVSVGQVMAV